MRKIFYFTLMAGFVLTQASCKKTCTVCVAKKADGTIVKTSNKVCAPESFNQSTFKDRFEKEFADYTVSCSEVSK